MGPEVDLHKIPELHVPEGEIFKKCYNPNGAFKAVDFRFPYEEESFDLIFLTSVFTHMQGAEVRHYLDEIRRALRPGGKCLTTCFLLNGESEGCSKRREHAKSRAPV